MEQKKLSESIKTLRKRKGISQEKLADYLNVSFQAVSKWETEAALPDIALLPELARFFGITVDELLQVKALDENKLYREYYEHAAKLSESQETEQMLKLWKEAYRKMPNRIDVKESLMCAYFDCDKLKYADEIIELGLEIYAYKGEFPAPDDIHNGSMFYQSQAVRMLAHVYYALGKIELSEDWARKAAPLYNCQDVIFAETSAGNDMLRDGSNCVYWFLKEMFHFAYRIARDEKVTMTTAQRIEACKTVIAIYEAVYRDDDMGYDSYEALCHMHLEIARLLTALEAAETESGVKEHLSRATQLAEKAATVTAHPLEHPLMSGIVANVPKDCKQLLSTVKKTLAEPVFSGYDKMNQQRF